MIIITLFMIIITIIPYFNMCITSENHIQSIVGSQTLIDM